MTPSVSKLQIFISWAGKQAETIGQGFRDYLPDVVNAIDPFISGSDIDKGSRWGEVLTGNLQESPCAIVCLTPESLDSIWVAFETGAISRAAGGPDSATARVWTYLMGLQNKDLQLSPFAAYQSTNDTEGETLRLVKSINQLSPDPASADSLKRRFDGVFWPRFSDVLKTAREIPAQSIATIKVPEPDILSEILLTVRSLQQDRRTRDPGTLSVNVIDMSAEPATIRRGQTLKLTYRIECSESASDGVWLGASFQDKKSEKWFYNLQEDKSISLKGIGTYDRNLTIPSDAPLGEQMLTSNVWRGVVSRSGSSKVIARCTPVPITIVE